MGSFIRVYGDPEITDEEKKKLFIDGAKKLIDEGGMMQLETVDMFDKRIALLHIPEENEHRIITFHYNYFGDCAWETAGLDLEKAHFWSEKKGSQQFSDVVYAIHVLQELYSDNYFFTTSDGDFYSGEAILGWINYVLGTDFTCDDRIKPWELYETLHDDEWVDEDSKIQDITELYWSLSPEGKSKNLGGYIALEYFRDKERFFKIHETVVSKEIDPSEDEKVDLIPFIKGYEKIAAELADAYGKSDTVLSELLDMLRLEPSVRIKGSENREDKDQETKKHELCGFFSAFTPTQIAVKVLSDIFGKDFWELWERIKGDISKREMGEAYAYAPEVFESLSENKDYSCLCPTADYLAIPEYVYRLSRDRDYDSDYRYDFSDDDRLYWWKPDGNVEVSEDIKTWLEELRSRYDVLMDSNLDLPKDMDYLKWLIELLEDVEDSFGRVYAFRDQYYEFLMNSADKRYIALTKLFENLIEEYRKEGAVIKRLSRSWDLGDTRIIYNPARLKIKRYLALIANNALRKEVFGF